MTPPKAAGFLAILLAILAIALWETYDFYVVTLSEVAHRAPIVRVWGGMASAPAVLVFFLFIFLLLLAKVTRKNKLHERLDEKSLAVGLTTLAAIVVVILFSTPVQNQFMPRFGYSRCEVLQDSPSLWFNDWVLNPAWCVRGKSPAWVQKAAKESFGAPPL